MRKVKSITRSTCTELREQLIKSINLTNKNLAKQIGAMRYSENKITVKIEFNLIDENGIAFSQVKVDLERYAKLDGLTDALGKTWVSNGQHFILTGYKVRSRKYPYVAKCVENGKSYKFTKNTVKNAMVILGIDKHRKKHTKK